MKLRKVLSLLVALAMMLEVLPLSLFANDMESVAEYTVSESVTVDASSLADNDELLEGYIEQLFGTGSNSGIMLAATYTGEDALDDVNLEVYTALKSAVANIASGAESSTVIAMTLTYDYSDFGVSTIDDAVTAFSAALDITSVVSYLLNDCPYELYWFDKTASVEIASSSISGSGTTMTVPLTVTMPVASAYQASGSTTTVDSSKVTAAQTAASYAQSLVSTYSGYSDEEKLEAFKEAICSLVSYETDYASADFGDIWQLVYVFDQDTSTNVVCEGYSKAFQYLCDLAGLESIIVTGTMSGGTGAGEHMWNVVYLDGVNYLVDVTNSDTGSVGQDGGLFMVCADDADASDETGYTFTVNNQTVSYVYDSTTLGLYPEDYLTLGTKASGDDDDDDDESTAHSVTVSIGTGCEDYLSATVDKTEAYEGETVTISVSTDSNHPEIYLQILTPYYNTEYGGTAYISSSYTDNGDGTYSFTMPDDYVLIFVYAGSYYITYGDDWSWSYGSIYWNCYYWDEETNIYISKTGVYDEGDVIYLTVSILPEYSTVYEVSEAVITDENGNTIEATLSGTGAYSWLDSNGDLIGEGIYYTFEFTMPASDVTVSAKLEEFSDDDTEHTITVYADDGVTYDVVGTATAGEEVTITFAPDDSSKTVEMSINRVLSRDSEGNTISWNVFIDKTYEGSATYSYTFAMSVCDLEIYLYAGQYTITSSTNIAYAGYVNVSDSLADEGDTVKVTVYNYQGYSFSDLSVVDEEGNAVSLTLKDSYEGDVTYSDGTGGIMTYNFYEFTMPASDVTITAIFEEALDYNVKISDTENCEVVSNMSTANEGNTVTLTVTPDTGYVVSTVTVEDADGNEITVTEASDGTYTFKMPASDVTVTVTVDIGSHTHTLTHVAAKDATCTEDGNTEYWYCDDCGKYFSDEDGENEITLDDTVVEATGHDYGCDAATFTLSVSAYSLMGYAQSGDTLDITLPYSLSASDDVVLPVSYTLTVNGVTVSLKGSDGTGSGTYTQTVDIGYVAMNYSDSANAMIPQSSTAVSGDIVITAIVDCSAYGSDCTIDVSDIGSWDFEFGYVQAGATTGVGVNADGMTITKTYESTNVSWTWSDDYSTATATFTCKNDSSHTETADATVTSETTDATCTATGSAVYTAVVDMDGTSYSDTKTVELPMVAHTEGEAVTENEVAATCTEDGSYESVVYCSVCGEELSRETITVDATGHNYVPTETTATCTEGGYTTYVCSECGDTYTDSETEALGHDYESEVTKGPTCTETGVMTYTCTRCDDSYTEEIDMIDHTYGEPEWTWTWSETEQTYTVAAKFTCEVCGGTDTETALVTSV
ncbi:MAG: hypothetical protein LUG23_07845, partial [Oscillospiraceae bacterium]|nr:hypothetical protein [Oscillospiraceae bacterium]